nr:MAG TPA: hypothetical protein [Caudoviricetes sp.]
MEHSYRDSTFRAFVEGRLADLTGSYWVCSITERYCVSCILTM